MVTNCGANAKTVKVRVATADYAGMQIGPKKLYRNDAGSRVMLTSFVDSVEVEAEIDPGTVALLEVVPDELQAATEL